MHRQMMSSTLIYFGIIVLQALMQIVLLPLQTHYLSPSEYGVLATVIASATVLSPVFNLGLHGAAQRFTVDYQHLSSEHNTLWSTLIVLCFTVGIAVASVALIVLSLLPANWFADFISVSYLLVAIIHSVAMGVILATSELLRMYHQPRRYALAMAIMSLSYILMNIIFVGCLHWQLQGALLAFALMPWIGCAALIFTNLNYCQWHFERRLARELLTYSTKLLPHFTFTTLNSVADRLLLMIIVGKHFTGIYTAGSMMASLMLMITSSIGFSARPQIYARFAQNTPTALAEVRQLTITSMLIIALAGANIALWSPEAITLLTSPAYNNAWQVTILLTLKYMLQGLAVFILCSVLYNKVKVHKLLLVAISSLFVLIFFSTQLAPHYGLWGVAIAGIIATLFELFFNYRLSKKTFGMIWPITKMLATIPLFFIPACCLVSVSIIMHWSFWTIIITKLLFSVATLMATLFIVSKQYRMTIPSLLAIIVPKNALKTQV